MDFSDAVRTGVALLRHRTGEFLPVYLAGTAAGVVGQSVVVVGVVLAYLSLRGTGRIQGVLEAGRDVDFADLADGTTTPAERELFEALGELLTPTVLAIGLGVVVVAAVALVVVRGLTAAAKVHAARALVADEPAVLAAVRGARADATTFVGFVLLQALLVLGPPVVGGLLAALVGGAAGAALLLLGLLVWLPFLLAFYVGLLFVREAIVVEGVGLLGGIRRNLSFIAANPARALVYVLFEVGVLMVAGLVTNVLSLLGASRVGAAISVVFVLPLLGIVKMATYVEGGPPPVARSDPGPAVGDEFATEGDADADEFEWVGDPTDSDAGTRSDPGSPGGSGASPNGRSGAAPTEGPGTSPTERADASPTDGPEPAPAGGPGTGRADDPAVARADPGSAGDSAAGRTGTADAATTATGRDPDPADPAESASVRADLSAGIRSGVAELARFGRDRPGLIAVALAVFGVGVVAGYAAAAPLGIDIAGDGAGGGFGLFPLDAALQISANNWLVAVAQAYAGIALGIPAVVNLLFNGLLVGALAGLGFDLRLFAALVVPHAVIEIPALAVSGALGLHLAARAVAFARGRRSAEAFAGDLRRAYGVLVGLLPVFVVAGFVEAFLTPLVGDLVRVAIGG